jgi:hypothetical protein
LRFRQYTNLLIFSGKETDDESLGINGDDVVDRGLPRGGGEGDWPSG